MAGDARRRCLSFASRVWAVHWIGANSFSYSISAILTKCSVQGTGLLEPGEVGISKKFLGPFKEIKTILKNVEGASNRNFKGRMGSPNAKA